MDLLLVGTDLRFKPSPWAVSYTHLDVYKRQLLGYDYQVQGDIGYQFALTLKTDLSSQNQIEDYFYSQLNDVSVTLRKCQVVVDGQTVGVVKDETALRDICLLYTSPDSGAHPRFHPRRPLRQHCPRLQLHPGHRDRYEAGRLHRHRGWLRCRPGR